MFARASVKRLFSGEANYFNYEMELEGEKEK
jgi:hypothetical protein